MSIDIVEVLKIIVPALGAWLLAYLTNKRERQQWLQKREANQEQMLASQIDKQSGAWSEMTTQMRQMITRLQELAVEAQTRANIAEEAAERYERELVNLKAKYEEALKLIEELKKKIPKKPASKGSI